MYSRDALEAVLQALTNNRNVGSISILAHSMGNYLTVETLRQMAIRDHGLPSKIRDVMLASPDIDVDVFRRQIAEIDAAPRTTQFTLFVSGDDKALGLSSFLARDSTRLGALDPTKEPYSSMLERARVNVIDLTSVASNDAANHSKFATGEVVAAIGDRLAQGQTLSDAKPDLVESLGTFTHGAIGAAADVAADATRRPDLEREVGRYRSGLGHAEVTARPAELSQMAIDGNMGPPRSVPDLRGHYPGEQWSSGRNKATARLLVETGGRRDGNARRETIRCAKRRQIQSSSHPGRRRGASEGGSAAGRRSAGGDEGRHEERRHPVLDRRP